MPEVEVAERSVRQYAEQIRGQLGLARREVFIPQHYEFGSEAQVDWYETTVELNGGRQVLQFFCLRASASGAASDLFFARRLFQPLICPYSRIECSRLDY